LRAGESVPGAQATVVRYGCIVPDEAAEPPSRGAKANGVPSRENQTICYPGLTSSLRCEDYLFRDSLGVAYMFARNVSFHLKSNMLFDYTRAFEKDVLPLLRKQNGFKDEITFAGPGGVDVIAISLWENKKDADNYNTNTYSQVLKTLARFIEGTPQVHTKERD
jgi:hypothetical protein